MTTTTPLAQLRTAESSPASPGVVVGVDTHQLTHTAAVLDTRQQRLGCREFPVSDQGYQDLITWAAELDPQGRVARVGVESTGSYGAGLTRHLLAAGHEVYDVARPEKATRVKHGKSDPVDAYSAAEQTLTGRAGGQRLGRPKDTTGVVEAIRTIKVPRDAAVADRTAAFNQLRDLVTTAPTPIHDPLIGLTGRQRVAKAAAMRPDPTRLAEPLHAARYALRAVARRIKDLDTEIAAADKVLARLVKATVPTLLAMRQVGPQTAAQLAITAGANLDRMTSESTFAKLTGTAPLPASSGKNQRHRLNRGGDRQANKALYLIVIGRMKDHPDTLAYLARKRAEGKTDREIIRCLKRHLARSIYRALKTDLMTP